MENTPTAPRKPLGPIASQPMPGAATGYIGQVPHERTPELAAKVLQTARTLLPVAQVAASCGLSIRTMYRHYRRELDQGRSETLVNIAAQEVKHGMTGRAADIKGDAESRRFILSRMLGLMSREPPAPEEEFDEDSGVSIDLSVLSAEELLIYGRLSAKIAGIDPNSIQFEVIGNDD